MDTGILLSVLGSNFLFIDTKISPLEANILDFDTFYYFKLKPNTIPKIHLTLTKTP